MGICLNFNNLSSTSIVNLGFKLSGIGALNFKILSESLNKKEMATINT